ncbi:hypothetical protein Tco_0368387 [Tanacetum coccineum]
MTSAMVEDEVRRWVKGEARRTELGTARRVREVRWVMSAATVVVERREETSERTWWELDYRSESDGVSLIC